VLVEFSNEELVGIAVERRLDVAETDVDEHRRVIVVPLERGVEIGFGDAPDVALAQLAASRHHRPVSEDPRPLVGMRRRPGSVGDVVPAQKRPAVVHAVA